MVSAVITIAAFLSGVVVGAIANAFMVHRDIKPHDDDFTGDQL